jgi:hypothetical protein
MPPPKKKPKIPTRGERTHELGDVNFKELPDFHDGPNLLPLTHQVVERYLWLEREEVRNPAVTITYEVLEIWNKANIPCLTLKYVQGKVLKLFQDFRFLNKFITCMTQEKKRLWFMPKFESFISSLPELFDLLP